MNQEERKKFLDDLLGSDKQVFSTIGVYANGSRQYNGVRREDLHAHVEYNLHYRSGRALIIEGRCVYSGHVDDKKIKSLEEELAQHPHTPSEASKIYF